MVYVSLFWSVGVDCVWVLERVERMFFGVIFIFDRIFVRGLWDGVVVGVGVFRLLLRLLGLVGIFGEGFDVELIFGGRKMNLRKCNI